jgi:hypothetical protein
VKQPFPYTRIISYGCSFTAGSELTDHDVIGITEEELSACARRNKYNGSHEILQHFSSGAAEFLELRQRILESNRTKSWPNYIAQKYNIPLLNRGIPGSSLSHTSYCILQDIHNKITQPTDLILVGITSPNRWFQFTHTGNPFYGVMNGGWSKLKHARATEKYREELENNWFNMYNILYSHNKEILFLSNLSDTMNGQIKMCYALAATPKDMLSCYEKQDSEFVSFCDKLVPNKHFLYAEDSMSGISGKQDYSTHHMFGHPRVESHIKFANILIEKLEEMYSD